MSSSLSVERMNMKSELAKIQAENEKLKATMTRDCVAPPSPQIVPQSDVPIAPCTALADR